MALKFFPMQKYVRVHHGGGHNGIHIETYILYINRMFKNV